MAHPARFAEFFVLVLVTAPAHAHADHGALSLDIGGGASSAILGTPTPAGFAVEPARTTLATSASATLGVRFALTNHLEFSAAGFYEPTVAVFHNGVGLAPIGQSTEPLIGTLADRYSRFGGVAGARWLWGTVWRFSIGCELGWARQSFSSLTHYDDRDPAAAVDYRLSLRDVVTDSALVSAGGGLEWVFADNMSVAVLPRLQLSFGHGFTPTITVPFVFSYSWYL